MSDRKPPTASSVGESKKWTFSFRFFRQIEFFGLSESQPKWFISLLERLQTLSELEVDAFRTNRSLIDSQHYHRVSWVQKNIPIQRKDLDWLPEAYREDEDDYPLIQFMVSGGLGRVAGFWDEHNVFNIVLLDPLHNLQPTNSHDYRVDFCVPLDCKYSSLWAEIEDAKAIRCIGAECPAYTGLKNVSAAPDAFNAVLIRLTDEELTDARAVIEDCNKTHAEIYIEGIYAVLQKNEKQNGSSAN